MIWAKGYPGVYSVSTMKCFPVVPKRDLGVLQSISIPQQLPLQSDSLWQIVRGCQQCKQSQELGLSFWWFLGDIFTPIFTHLRKTHHWWRGWGRVKGTGEGVCPRYSRTVWAVIFISLGKCKGLKWGNRTRFLHTFQSHRPRSKLL